MILKCSAKLTKLCSSWKKTWQLLMEISYNLSSICMVVRETRGSFWSIIKLTFTNGHPYDTATLFSISPPAFKPQELKLSAVLTARIVLDGFPMYTSLTHYWCSPLGCLRLEGLCTHVSQLTATSRASPRTSRLLHEYHHTLLSLDLAS